MKSMQNFPDATSVKDSSGKKRKREASDKAQLLQHSPHVIDIVQDWKEGNEGSGVDSSSDMVSNSALYVSSKRNSESSYKITECPTLYRSRSLFWCVM